jgi:acetyl-CoA C-acetyltransferase
MIGRASYTDSPALRAVLSRTLDISGLASPEMIDVFDLYSCFPSAVRIAAECLGITGQDPRPLTTTGGLAFAGGPGNSYVLHSLAALCDRLVAGPKRTGLVTGVGMFFTKHTATVLSTDEGMLGRAACTAEFRVAETRLSTPIPVEHLDRGVLETYTVDCDRSGAPVTSVAFVRSTDGHARTVGQFEGEAAIRQLLAAESIGMPVRIERGADGRNLLSFAQGHASTE